MKRAVFLLVILASGTAAARPFTFKSNTRYAQVEFSYSSEAALVPALVSRFKGDLAKARTKTVTCGKAESAVRVKSGGQPIACSSITRYTTSGQTLRLLSLARLTYAFTGGAHGNGGTTPLLWDRRLDKEVRFASLFRHANGYSASLRAPYCLGLTAERRKRRGPDWQPSPMTPEFDSCPAFSELSLIPSGSGRFRLIHVIATPYTAGPYTEGEYDIALPVTPALIAALKPEYRASFAAQPQ